MKAWVLYAMEVLAFSAAAMFVAIGLGSIARWITEQVMKDKG